MAKVTHRDTRHVVKGHKEPRFKLDSLAPDSVLLVTVLQSVEYRDGHVFKKPSG